LLELRTRSRVLGGGACDRPRHRRVWQIEEGERVRLYTDLPPGAPRLFASRAGQFVVRPSGAASQVDDVYGVTPADGRGRVFTGHDDAIVGMRCKNHDVMFGFAIRPWVACHERIGPHGQSTGRENPCQTQ